MTWFFYRKTICRKKKLHLFCFVVFCFFATPQNRKFHPRVEWRMFQPTSHESQGMLTKSLRGRTCDAQPRREVKTTSLARMLHAARRESDSRNADFRSNGT